MRKVIYIISVSLDGFIEAADGDLSWSFPDAELHQHFNDLEAETGTALYGRGLYENMSAFWPTAGQDPSAPAVEVEYARIWKAKPKVVFSKTLKEVGWNSRLVSGDAAEEVRRLKAQPGKDMTVGGAGLAASLLGLGLVDECRLYVHPVVLGSGKPAFGGLHGRVDLVLVEAYTFGSGVVRLTYRPAAGQIGKNSHNSNGRA